MNELTGPFVSVVVPAYNCVDTIVDALRSVEAQTFRDFEVIIVDDCSTDGTVDLLLSRYPHYQIIAGKANMGPAVSRNRGVTAAKGEWIAFLDADDAWLPARLEGQIELISRYPEAAMFCGGTLPFGKEFGPTGARRTAAQTAERNRAQDRASESVPVQRSLGEANQRINESTRPIRLEEFAVANPVATSTVLIRKDTFKTVGGFDERFRGPEDYDLWMRTAAKHPVFRSVAPLCRYRQSLRSLSSDDRTFLPEILRVLDKAYGPGGVLRCYPGERKARAYHYLCCSWMAAARGAVGRAYALFCRSLLLWARSFGPYNEVPWGRSKLLVYFAKCLTRRVMGKRTATCPSKSVG